MTAIALVADIGESFGPWQMGDDAALLELLTDANVACGFHAGDPQVMEATVAACVERGVGIGAHPGFSDLRGFGRRRITQSAAEVRADVLYQLGALSAFVHANGTRLGHVTVHGAMDNLAVVDRTYAEGIVEAVTSFDRSLMLVSQGGELDNVAAQQRVRTVSVFMADRGYLDDGRLVDRGAFGAVLSDSAEIADRTVRAVREGVVRTVSGTDLPVNSRAVLVHGDTAQAVRTAREIHHALRVEGIELRSLATLEHG